MDGLNLPNDIDQLKALIAERTGAKIGPGKLRNLNSHMGDIMEPQREACQVKQLEEWIDEARKHSKHMTLADSRDGVSLGIAPFGNFEMASVATLSVYAGAQQIMTLRSILLSQTWDATFKKALIASPAVNVLSS